LRLPEGFGPLFFIRAEMGLSIRFRGLIAQVTTLESVYTALAEDRYPVAVPEEVAAPARRAIERMLEA